MLMRTHRKEKPSHEGHICATLRATNVPFVHICEFLKSCEDGINAHAGQINVRPCAHKWHMVKNKCAHRKSF